MNKLVKYSREGSAGIVTLDRPPLNLLDLRFLTDLLGALEAAKADSACRAVVIESGNPEFFCAGLDLKAVIGWSEDELRTVLNHLYLDLMDVQAALGKPTIAAASGKVRGGGITLSIQCDVIMADETSDFAYSEIDAGVIPAIHLSHLPRQTGRHIAFVPLFTGESFGAERAMQLGLTDRIVPGNGARRAARELAGVFAAKPPTTMKLARDAFHRVNDQGRRKAVEDVIETFVEATLGPDGKEGIAAFIEKRKPEWRA